MQELFKTFVMDMTLSMRLSGSPTARRPDMLLHRNDSGLCDVHAFYVFI